MFMHTLTYACSQQHDSELLICRSNPSVHQLLNGQTQWPIHTGMLLSQEKGWSTDTATAWMVLEHMMLETGQTQCVIPFREMSTTG